MRINVNINEPKKTQDMAILQTWIEQHKDGEQSYFVAVKLKDEALVFEFTYDWVLGCHRFFIYDPIDDTILSFFAEDFTDIGNWIFKRCDEHFGSDYTIIM